MGVPPFCRSRQVLGYQIFKGIYRNIFQVGIHSEFCKDFSTEICPNTQLQGGSALWLSVGNDSSIYGNVEYTSLKLLESRVCFLCRNLLIYASDITRASHEAKHALCQMRGVAEVL